MSKQLFIKAALDAEEVSGLSIVLASDAGKIIFAGTSGRKVGEQIDVRGIFDSDEDFVLREEFVYTTAYNKSGHPFLIVGVRNSSPSAKIVAGMLANNIANIDEATRDIIDADKFVRSVLYQVIPQSEIYELANQLEVDTSLERIVFCVKLEKFREAGSAPIDVLKELFSNEDKNFVIQTEEDEIAVLYHGENELTKEFASEVAGTILSALNTEAYCNAIVGCGRSFTDLKEASVSFKEAKSALEVGLIFYDNKSIIHFSELGVGRLIYNLPASVCQQYIKEVFADIHFEELDDEMLNTINRFFKDNLSISEASRQLFIHRNTLVYRLDKLQKVTGIDLRNFDEAMRFQLGLMATKYIDFVEGRKKF